MPLLEEHWFDEFYRVLVIREDDEIIVSVDLYAEVPCTPGSSVLRLGETSLTYIEVEPRCLGIEAGKAELLVLDAGTGSCELIGARIHLEPAAETMPVDEIYRIVKSSWRRCMGIGS